MLQNSLELITRFYFKHLKLKGDTIEEKDIAKSNSSHDSKSIHRQTFIETCKNTRVVVF